MNCKDEDVFSGLKVEDFRVCLRNTETKVSEGAHKDIIPLLAGLLESVKELVQPLHTAITFLISQGLLHINVFSLAKLAIEVHAIEVKRIDLPVIARGNRKDELNTGHLGHRRVGVKVVDPINLHETASNELRLVLVDAPIGLALHLKDLLAAYNVSVSRVRNGLPCTSFLQHSYFLVHCFFLARPIGVGLCITNGTWIVVSVKGCNKVGKKYV
jgi:hypothetical protein